MPNVCLIIAITLYARAEIVEGVSVFEFVAIEHDMCTLLFQFIPFPVWYGFIPLVSRF